MRIVGMDIHHRSFAQVAILENGQITRELVVDLDRRRVAQSHIFDPLTRRVFSAFNAAGQPTRS
jgi:hypothetical protein